VSTPPTHRQFYVISFKNEILKIGACGYFYEKSMRVYEHYALDLEGLIGQLTNICGIS
jgi:hypothetical protein